MAKTSKKNKSIDENNKTQIPNDKIKETFSSYSIDCDEKIEVSKIMTKTENVSNISIIELLSLENACALICKKYEMAARIDRENNEKFKEYSGYYQIIFEELEKRVFNFCK